ncbi:hypothetical protein DC498_10545 [Terrimonas sp.]|uniref:hypothetical protein n=1 Tax=Terrimonas sp. TaxID=1914338 RepID=UPI000D5201BE|nr:hypothetical protein [Terrimonas sp.]PVD52161.1 hypothetical protein DC498_10545 [Terrimonas sp.]
MAANKQYTSDSQPEQVNEPDALYTAPPAKSTAGFVFESEEQRLLKDAEAAPVEKLMSFTRMIRRNAMFKKLQ